MIVKNEREQWIGCDLCGDVTELRRTTIANPETVLMMMEQLREEHKDCEKHKDDPRKAAIERGFKVRLRREMERLKKPLNGRARKAA